MFHWSQPCNRSCDSRVGCESRGIIEKRGENAESVYNFPTGRYTSRQNVMISPTRCMVGDIFCTVSTSKSAKTSPKTLIDKV